MALVRDRALQTTPAVISGASSCAQRQQSVGVMRRRDLRSSVLVSAYLLQASQFEIVLLSMTEHTTRMTEHTTRHELTVDAQLRPHPHCL